MNWYPVEMHCHTIHSDGHFTPAQLAAHARAFGLSGFCLTDHNTRAGVAEIQREAEAQGLSVLPGTEWTTYFGHMLVQGCTSCMDWEEATRDNLESLLPQIHEAGGLVGPAHPFRPGNPFGTGCHWEYRIQDWKHFDFYEVLSGEDPTRRYYNHRALAHWTSLLDAGCRLTPTSGIDWHRPLKEGLPYATTWMGTEKGLSPEAMKAALRQGRTAVSIGPLPMLTLKQQGQTLFPGDQVAAGSVTAVVEADMQRRAAQWSRWQLEPLYWQITGPGGAVLFRLPFQAEEQETPSFEMPAWCRAELYGLIGEEPSLLGFTGPLYRR